MKKIAEKDFEGAWGGISSLQLGLSIVWSVMCRNMRGDVSKAFSMLPSMASWLSENPARLLDVFHRCGSIEVGKEASFCVWDPHSSFTVTPDVLLFKNKVSPYLNHTLQGVVRYSFIRGNLIYANAKNESEAFLSSIPRGCVLNDKKDMDILDTEILRIPSPEASSSNLFTSKL